MGDLTKHFSRSEFACKCGCGFDTVDVKLMDILYDLRVDMNAAITINSGCRCPAHNLNIKGSTNSQHLHGRAADIVVEGVDPAVVYEWLENKFDGHYGLGKYNTFTHLDSRTDGPARW